MTNEFEQINALIESNDLTVDEINQLIYKLESKKLPPLFSDEFKKLVSEYNKIYQECCIDDFENKKLADKLDFMEIKFIEKYGKHSKEHEMWNVLIGFNYIQTAIGCDNLGYTYGLDSKKITKESLIDSAVDLFKAIIYKDEKHSHCQLGRFFLDYHYFEECEDNPHYFNLVYSMEYSDNAI